MSPALAVTQQVALGGHGWRLAQAPPSGIGALRETNGLTTFAADTAGQWRLEDDAGATLTLRASAHDKTPLDCGRSDCHASIAEMAVSSPMSQALERQLGASGAAPDGVTCALDCHVTGERGLRDGGFLDLASKLGWMWLGRTSWQDLPRALRRPGGVRCSGCHGPGAIPEPGARTAIVRSDVCATCHDAPPAYVHVQQWRASRMARSDEQPETRSRAACARCHTTAGFLAAVGIRKHDEEPDDSIAGVACAACHAPHGAHRGEKLVRAIDAPEVLGGKDLSERVAPSAPCLNCHAPTPEEEWLHPRRRHRYGRGTARCPGFGWARGECWSRNRSTEP